MAEKIGLRRELFNQRASGMTSYFLNCVRVEKRKVTVGF